MADAVPTGMDFSQYATWNKVTTPSGGTYYAVPGSSFVYDPFMSMLKGRPVLWRNPTPQLQAEAEAKEQQEKLAKAQADAMSPAGQLLPIAGGTAGTIGAAYAIDALLSGGTAAVPGAAGAGAAIAPVPVVASALPQVGLQAPGLAAIGGGGASAGAAGAGAAEGALGGFGVGGGAGGGAGAAGTGGAGAAGLLPTAAGVGGVIAVPLAAKLIGDALFPDAIKRPFVASEAAASPYLDQQVTGFSGMDIAQREQTAQRLADIGVLSSMGAGKIDKETGQRVSKDASDPWIVQFARGGQRLTPQQFTLEEQIADALYGPGSINNRKADSAVMTRAREALGALYGEENVDAKLREIRALQPYVEQRKKESGGSRDWD